MDLATLRDRIWMGEQPEATVHGRPSLALQFTVAFSARTTDGGEKRKAAAAAPSVAEDLLHQRLEESEDDAESTTSDLMPPPSQRARPSPLPHSVHPSPVASKAKSGSHAKGTLSASASVASLQGMAGGGAQPPPSAGYAPTPQYGSGPVGVVTDWSLPPRPALPVKPVGAALGGFTYSKTPTDPKEVMEDFSDRKAPSAQIPIHTFWKEVESWMKPVGEEDVAWLEFDADDVEPFLTPSLGRHYTEVWKEEDRLAEIAAAAAAQTWPRGYSLDRTYKVEENGVGASQGGFGDIRKEDAEWDPRTIEGEELLREDKGLGPVTERLVSALLLDEGQALGRMGKEEDGGMKGKVGAGVTGVGEMESRIRVELRALGLLSEEEPNFENPVDDEITSTLRRCQALLGRQRKVNLARKNRLLSIARDRLAYQDYVNTLEGLEKSITAGFTKMLKARAPKKKKESKVPNGGGSEEVASGLGGKVVLEVSEGLTEKVLLRERWVDLFGRAMAEWDEREEGRLTGLPEKSIYEGIEEVGGE
ncbi:Transcriptional regulator [Tulasnella sp. 403]|nr:Transcriptional regulator [Tulasnella sp. 403]